MKDLQANKTQTTQLRTHNSPSISVPNQPIERTPRGISFRLIPMLVCVCVYNMVTSLLLCVLSHFLCLRGVDMSCLTMRGIVPKIMRTHLSWAAFRFPAKSLTLGGLNGNYLQTLKAEKSFLQPDGWGPPSLESPESPEIRRVGTWTYRRAQAPDGCRASARSSPPELRRRSTPESQPPKSHTQGNPGYLESPWPFQNGGITQNQGGCDPFSRAHGDPG